MPRAGRSVLGGAGNVANNIAALGARAVLVGLAGCDAAGDELEAVLAATPGVTARLVAPPSGRPR